MNVDMEFLKKTVNARLDVGKWLAERPYTGLDVTDVALLVEGYDYLARIIKDITGEDFINIHKQVAENPSSATIQITIGE